MFSKKYLLKCICANKAETIFQNFKAENIREHLVKIVRFRQNILYYNKH